MVRPCSSPRSAGSGKTTLLVDWFTNDRIVDGGWVTVDHRHNERGRIAGACAAALGFGSLAETGPDTMVIDQLFAAIEARGTPVVLVLDDVHANCVTRRNEAVGHLALYTPPLLTLVLTTAPIRRSASIACGSPDACNSSAPPTSR